MTEAGRDLSIRRVNFLMPLAIAFYDVGYGDAYGFVFGDDNFAMTDEDVVGVDVDIVIYAAVKFDNRAASEFEQLVDAECGGSERYGYFDIYAAADVFAFGVKNFCHCHVSS